MWDARTGWHLLAALAVVVLAWGCVGAGPACRGCCRRWPWWHWP